MAGQYVDGVNKRRLSSSRPRAVQQQITLLCLWNLDVDIKIRNTNQESSDTPVFTFTFISLSLSFHFDDVNKRRLSCSRPRAVQCTSLPSLTLPPITTLERCKSTRILTLRQINTQKSPAQQHFKTNHLKKSPFDIKERLFLKSFEVKSTWPSRYLWWIEEADSQDQFKW